MNNQQEKKSFVSLCLLAMAPIIKFIDKAFSVPFNKKKVTGEHYYMWRDRICEGTVFLTNTLGVGSNLINPSDINHSAIYFGRGLYTYLIETLNKNPSDVDLLRRINTILKDKNIRDDIRYVIEATGHGVVPTDLVTFLTTKDLVVGKKPTFCDSELSMDASRIAVYDLGKEYDYSFSHAEDTKYCFEVCADAYEKVVEGKKLKRIEYRFFSLKLHDTFMSDTFQTDDWKTVFDSRDHAPKYM